MKSNMARFQKKKRLYIGLAVFILMGGLHLPNIS